MACFARRAISADATLSALRKGPTVGGGDHHAGSAGPAIHIPEQTFPFRWTKRWA
jgi:hypothetical protein